MPGQRTTQLGLGRLLADACTHAANLLATLRNAVVANLPGERPTWLVVELSGSYPARRKKPALLQRFVVLGGKAVSLEEFEEVVDGLLRAPWLKGVVFRLDRVNADLATAFALRRQLTRLREGGKQVVVTTSSLTTTSYYLATAADRIVAPEGAELFVNGMSLSTTFMADALARFGVRFDKLAIDEYKNAGDQLARSTMSEAQREQYGALLDSFQQTLTTAIADARGATPEAVRGWIDAGVTSAAQAADLDMIDEVAYEDTWLTKRHRLYAGGRRFIPLRTRSTGSRRVAVVSLTGNIVTGASRTLPVPIPLFGTDLAGSETLVRTLRAAGGDDRTAAVVFHVDSGGGSALASDLIWREVSRLATRLPVVAVMGQYAASGGYYVLTHATEVIAAPTTITGSIGVVMLKPVLEEFNARYGFAPESVTRGRFADIMASARGFDEEERALLERYNQEVYGRFVARVAAGRGLSEERVREIGRGRIWSGADALELGLVDRLGDVALAVVRARELAGLPGDAPVWNVEPPKRYLPPVIEDPRVVLGVLGELLEERALLLHPHAVRVR